MLVIDARETEGDLERKLPITKRDASCAFRLGCILGRSIRSPFGANGRKNDKQKKVNEYFVLGGPLGRAARSLYRDEEILNSKRSGALRLGGLIGRAARSPQIYDRARMEYPFGIFLPPQKLLKSEIWNKADYSRENNDITDAQSLSNAFIENSGDESNANRDILQTFNQYETYQRDV